MIVSHHEQRSLGWHKNRLGLPTASCFHKIITTRGEPSKQRDKYLIELAGEILTGRPANRYVNARMQEAAEAEDDSRLYYEIVHSVEVQQVGLCWKDEQKMFGASPDGLIGSDGGFETKDALPHVQIERILKKWQGMDHFQQCMGCMLVCERQWWDLQSYCEGMEPITIRFERDPVFIEALESELNTFCRDLYRLIRKIKGG